MGHHKRKRPKHRRAGCLMCKAHKDERGKNGFGAQSRQEQRARVAERYDEFDFGPGPASRKQRKGKPYTIEVRWLASWMRESGWSVWKRYARPRDRDNALRALRHKASRWPGKDIYTFRAGPAPDDVEKEGPTR
jgi:hypothetical protein